VRQDRLIRQIAFPKLVLPVSTAVAGVVSFAWGMVPLALLLLVYSDHVSPMLLFVPIIAAVQFVFTLAVAILVSAANVFFRDLGNAAGHGLRLWWFLSPGLYSMAWVSDLEFVKENPIIGFLAGLNPFAVLFEAYRAVIYGTAEGPRSFIPPHPPDFLALAFMLVASLVLLALSVIFFKRVEPEFAKVL
jgi:ABC-type polysaccharide/polyol phosphate export permease